MNSKEMPDNLAAQDIFINEFKKLENFDELGSAIDKAIEKIKEYGENITSTNIKDRIINLISEKLNISIPEDEKTPTNLEEYYRAETALLNKIIKLRQILPDQAKKHFGSGGSTFAGHSDPDKNSFIR